MKPTKSERQKKWKQIYQIERAGADSARVHTAFFDAWYQDAPADLLDHEIRVMTTEIDMLEHIRAYGALSPSNRSRLAVLHKRRARAMAERLVR